MEPTKNNSTKNMIPHMLAIDCSGSVGGSSGYWSLVQRVKDKICKRHGANVSIIAWDTSIDMPTDGEIEEMIRRRIGRGGTDPSIFCHLLPRGCDLTIVTDGDIGDNCVRKCDEILDSRRFGSVKVYFQSTGGHMNLSVSAPFTRNCEHVEIIVGERTIATANTTKDVDLTIYYDNPSLFIESSDKILSEIVLRCAGKLNMALRDEVIKLEHNLLQWIANSPGGDYDEVRGQLTAGRRDDAIISLRKIISAADTSLARRINHIAQELMKHCTGAGGFKFDLLEPGRLTRAIPVAHVATEELPNVEPVGQFECPITCEEEFPVLFIKKGEPILGGLSKRELDDILSEPLLILGRPELVQLIRDRTDCTIGFGTAKKLFTSGCVVSPYTREIISSALICSEPRSLGTDGNVFRKAVTFTLADIFLGDKLVGCPELWLAVVYLAIRDLERIDSDFIGIFRDYLIARMRSGKTNITLTGLPIEPVIKAPVDIALWHCISSPEIMKNNREASCDRLREFAASAAHMMTLLDMMNYAYDVEWTTKRLALYNAFAWMMTEENNHVHRINGVQTWRILLRAQYQNSLTIMGTGCNATANNATIILLDGPATSPPPMPYFGLSLGEMIALADLVDNRKSAKCIQIPEDLSDYVPMHITNYSYNLPNEYIREPVPICPQTMRPYVVDRRAGKHWKICAELAGGTSLANQISNYNYFVRNIAEFGAYPTKNEFIIYTAIKQSGRLVNPLSTLPAMTMAFVDGLFNDYEAVLGPGFANVPAYEFNRIAANSQDADTRARIDGSLASTL